nr:DUF6153 family protein [Agrococcus sp. REN33]
MTGERMLLPGRALPRDGRSLRALLLLAGIVLLLVVGLLGMHQLGPSAAGHGAAAPVVAGHHALAPGEHAADQATGEHAAGQATGPSAAGHGAAAPVVAGHHALAPGEHAADQATGEHAAGQATGEHAAGHATARAAGGHPDRALALGDAPPAPAEPEHAMLMACVLALLAGLIVLARPAPVRRSWLNVAMRPATSLRPRAARAGLPPPSLTQLSISRT